MTGPLRSLAALSLLVTLAGAPLVALHGQPPQQEEFVPIDQLPPQDQLPAAPLLIGAYVFVLVAFAAYLLSVARKLETVRREIQRLEDDLKRGGGRT